MPPTSERAFDATRTTAPDEIRFFRFLTWLRRGGASRVTSETRVFGTDAASVRRFGVYWRIIQPGSGLIRRMWLRAIQRRAAEGARS